MGLAELGEFGLIRRLTGQLVMRPDVVVAPGDDAAVLTPGPGQQLVATIDAQVEGRHFLRSVASGYDIGYKALAVNLSDIAAMGAAPAWALVSLLVPPDTPLSLLDDLYLGMNELAREFDVAIVGGNVSGTDGPLAVDVALLGLATTARTLLRGGAAPGDAILVTGALGAAAAGVLTLQESSGRRVDEQLVQDVRQAMLRPRPLVREGERLAALGVITAILDVSDGLVADLGHLCAASHVGAVIVADAVPIHPAARVIAQAYKREPLDLALSGGEDYQLLFTVRPEHIQSVQSALAETGTVTAEIGAVTADTGRLELQAPDGSRRPLRAQGWDHLRRG